MRKIKRILTAFVFCLILSASTIPVCASAVSASNEETGYVYVLDDSADFLTDSQENSLQKQLYDLTAYCNVAFVTTTEYSKSSTEDFAADYFDDVFGPHANGTIFVIDRCLNEIYLYSDGQAHKIITNSRARSITDNTYTYARDKDYYTCANKTFAQIETLMQGKRIAEPMRYLCSALLAIVAALFLNLFFALWSSRSHKADRRQVMTGLYAQMQINNPRTQFINQTRTYSPVSSGSSGGGHSGGGGGGGGGAAVLIGVGAAAAITAGVIMMSPVDVKGRVVLADQAAVPGAKVSLLQNGNVVTQTTADESGHFSLKAKRGDYELTVVYTDANGQFVQKTSRIKAPTKDFVVTF